MGSPEIVDVARNFTVMVRVQGPDPKGLKMRNHAFHHYNSGKTTISASGMLLPSSFQINPLTSKILGDKGTLSLPGSALVVTVASIVEPFLSLQHRENISQGKPDLIAGVHIDIMVEGKMGVDGVKVSDELAPYWVPAQLLKLVDIPPSSTALQSLIEASSGSLEHGWEVGWSLASCSNGPHPSVDAIKSQIEQPSMQNQTQMSRGQSSNPSLMAKSNTRIALLGVSSIIVEDLPNLNISPSNKRGDLLLAMGSPFGVLTPLHFFNSISVGSISNCSPSSSSATSLLMADIRCLPGMEGGPVFGEHARLIGILTRPIRQKTSGAEIQLVIPWEAIANGCGELLQEEPQNELERIHYNNGNLNAVGKTSISNPLKLDISVSPVERAMASICLITIDEGVWASGILLNKRGLILTNAHLLEPWRFGKSTANLSVGDEPSRPKFNLGNIRPRNIRVRLDHTDSGMWYDAKVVYVSKGPLDVALLQLEFVPDHLRPIVTDLTCLSPGSKAFVIGHGLFGPRCDFLPSVCVGVVAKVVEVKRDPTNQSSLQENVGHFPAMLETTAAVHPGCSGGAVVNSVGHMIGIVTSNARHGGGMAIPYLNFSIPCAALEPIFKFSKDMEDLSLLQDLDKPNEHLSSVWALMPPLSPKPGPSFPNLPQLLPGGEGNKDGKGSRFAKFIAERHEVFKKTTQLGKLESRSTGFIPSKL